MGFERKMYLLHYVPTLATMPTMPTMPTWLTISEIHYTIM